MYKYLLFLIIGIILFVQLNNKDGFSISGKNEGDNCRDSDDCQTIERGDDIQCTESPFCTCTDIGVGDKICILNPQGVDDAAIPPPVIPPFQPPVPPPRIPPPVRPTRSPPQPPAPAPQLPPPQRPPPQRPAPRPPAPAPQAPAPAPQLPQRPPPQRPAPAPAPAFHESIPLVVDRYPNLYRAQIDPWDVCAAVSGGGMGGGGMAGGGMAGGAPPPIRTLDYNVHNDASNPFEIHSIGEWCDPESLHCVEGASCTGIKLDDELEDGLYYYVCE